MNEKSKNPNKLKKNTRVKVTLACTYCQYRKIKCSGVKPCTNCTKHEQECYYINLPVRRGPRKVDVEIIFCKEKRVADAYRAELYQRKSQLVMEGRMANFSQENVPTTNIKTPQHEILNPNDHNDFYYITQIPPYSIPGLPLSVNADDQDRLFCTDSQVAGITENPVLPPHQMISTTEQYFNLLPAGQATSPNGVPIQNNYYQVQTPQFSFNPNFHDTNDTNFLESDFTIESHVCNPENGC